MATREQIAVALKRAHAAGDQQAARKLAAAYNKTAVDAQPFLAIPKAPDGSPEIGQGREPGQLTQETFAQQPELGQPDLVSPAIGAGEAALTVGTGLTGGTAGMIGGMLKGMAEQILSGQFGTQQAAETIAESAGKGAEMFTYAPRTESGQRQVEAVGKAGAQLAPLMAITPVEGAIATSSLANTVRPALQVAAGTAKRGATAVAGKIKDSAAGLLGREAGEGGFGAASAGAAEAPDALIRDTNAQLLGFEGKNKLTKGQRTREFGQQQFERETAKNAQLGTPLRERFENQNAKLQTVLDDFIDQTGGVAPDLRSVGVSVEKGLRSRAAVDKAKIRTLYKEAEKAGELEAPVTLGKLVEHLNASVPEAEVANVLKAARAKAIQLGIAVEENGQLVAQPSTLKNAELFRRSVRAATNQEPTNIRQGQIMRELLDEQTATAGGALYKKAREARARFASNYENNLTVKNLLGTKRGASDRAVAYEDVLNRTILAPSQSLDNVRHIRRLLQTQGEEGAQAWKDLQAATLNHIKEEALKNVGTNQRGDKIFSAAQFKKQVTALDKNGKLDFVFGKQGAEKLRTLNEIAQDVLVAVPGAVNHSNTASALAALVDLTLSATTGIPAPLASAAKLIRSQIKDAKLKARLDRSLQ